MDIYNKIKKKNPNLSHLDILRIQTKINVILEDKQKNINHSFHTEKQNRINSNIVDKTYVPRLHLPELQMKINRNQLDDNYQDVYKERKKLETKFTLDIKYCLNLFELEDTYTIEELKNKYKKLVFIHHPDKGGDAEKFKFITSAFNFLSEKLKEKETDKQFNQLKQGFKDYSLDEKPVFKKDKFDIDTFNKIYSENKLESASEFGYGDWKTQNESEDNDKILNKFELNSFNDVFNKTKENSKKQEQIIEYQEPEAFTKGTNMNYADIEDAILGDYSSNLDSDLKFTDYKKAHSNTHLININEVKVKEYKHVEDLEKERDNIPYKMTDEEERKYQLYKIKQQEQEEIRKKNIQSQEQKYEEHFKKINKLMLNN